MYFIRKEKETMAHAAGFTLIELVVTLVLVGIMGVGIAFFLIPGVQGYLLMQENADLTQKAQFAMTRLAQEFRNCCDCNGTDGTVTLPYAYATNIEDTLEDRTLDWVGSELQVNGYTLIDQVQSFQLIRDQVNASSPVFMKVDLVLALERNEGTKTYNSTTYCRNIYR